MNLKKISVFAGLLLILGQSSWAVPEIEDQLEMYKGKKFICRVNSNLNIFKKVFNIYDFENNTVSQQINNRPATVISSIHETTIEPVTLEKNSYILIRAFHSPKKVTPKPGHYWSVKEKSYLIGTEDIQAIYIPRSHETATKLQSIKERRNESVIYGTNGNPDIVQKKIFDGFDPSSCVVQN